MRNVSIDELILIDTIENYIIKILSNLVSLNKNSV